MFSVKCEEQIEKGFQQAMCELGSGADEILQQMTGCTPEEMILMKYLYGTMPISDAVNYSFAYFLDYGRHGVYLWNKGAYGIREEEELFLHYVVYHRINEEDISPCRSFFYSQFHSRISELSMEKAALEINYWCAEEATYQSTDDRTVSPMTVYQSGFGRCGEESTFTVSALRSAGIPARQVYAPRWSHCDDNHAWVEVWCEGEWHFMGACEPEKILNKGWFTNASSRAMLIHSRWFGSEGSNEDVIQKEGRLYVLNQTQRYANTVRLMVKVEDEWENPIQGAMVDFEILNYSEFYPVASVLTDEKGNASMVTGLGSCHIQVSKEERFGECLVNTNESSTCTIRVSRTTQKDAQDLGKDTKSELKEMVWQEFDMIAPKDAKIHTKQPTKEQKEAGELRFAQASSMRQRKIEQMYKKEEAAKLASIYGEDILSILEESRGNFPEIEKFLQSEEHQEWRKKLLGVLSKKDYRDLKSHVLEDHIHHALLYSESIKEEIFVSYLLNPRIHTEPMTAYRGHIFSLFSREEKELFRNAPEKIWFYICKNIREREDLDCQSLVTAPCACLDTGIGSKRSKEHLFVAVCRTLGIPARLNPADLSMEYYADGTFHRVEKSAEKTCQLELYSGDTTNWVYFQNWTIAIRKSGRYHSLNLNGLELQNNHLLSLEPGEYRIITSNRLPNGNLFAKSCHVTLETGDYKKIMLTLREAKLSDMLEHIELNDFQLKTGNGSLILASELVNKRTAGSISNSINKSIDELSIKSISEQFPTTMDEKNLIIWLEESKEPTEHILNELYERKEEFNSRNHQIIFVLRNKKALQDPTLSKTLKAIPKIRTYYDEVAENVNTLGRRMYVDPDKLPLILVINSEMIGIYATSGYNVGTGDMLLRILK